MKSKSLIILAYIFLNLYLSVSWTPITPVAQATSVANISLSTAGSLPSALWVFGQPNFSSNLPNRGGNLDEYSLWYPTKIAKDSNENLYIADTYNNRVLFFQKGDLVASRVYGQPNFKTSLANNGGISATSLYQPFGVALDKNDNLYIADTYNHRVLFYQNGSTTATRVYGQLGSFFTANSNDSLPTPDSLFFPHSVKLDSADNLYIVDGGNRRILYFTNGQTTASAVYGQLTFTTRDTCQPGTMTYCFEYPYDIALDSGNNLYVADYNGNRVLYFPNGSSSATRVYGKPDFSIVGPSYEASESLLSFVCGVEVDSADNLYVADCWNNRVVRYKNGDTKASFVYGQPDFTSNTINYGGLSATSLQFPFDILVDKNNNVYISDFQNNRVLFFSSSPNPTTVHSATFVYGQGGSFTTNLVNNGGISSKSLSNPIGIAVDNGNNVYVADDGNNRILYYQNGSITSTNVYGQPDLFTNTANTGGVSGNTLNTPAGLALDNDGGIYVADAVNNRVLYYPKGSTLASRVYGQDDNFTTNQANKGGISSASLYQPLGVIVDKNNNLYIADYGNNRVLFYLIGSTTATRVYGQPDFSSNSANNGGISANSLNNPGAVIVDPNNNLYITDINNHRVLYYPSGNTTATRVYGQGGSFTTNQANKGGVSPFSLENPYGLAINSLGELYIVDSLNNRVLYYPQGSTTATGVYGQPDLFSNAVNNGGISAISLADPSGVQVDKQDNVYITDTQNNRVLFFGPLTYSISGKVTDINNNPIPEVTISAGSGPSVLTGTDGTYTITGLAAGDYTVTPSRDGYNFTPPFLPIINLSSNISDENFIASKIISNPATMFIFLEGIGSELKTGNGVCSTDPKDAFYGIQTKLKRLGFVCSDFLRYSYNNGSVDTNGIWKPNPYTPSDTGNNMLVRYSYFLSKLITDYRSQHPNVQFVLIGHSLGGLIILETIKTIGILPNKSVISVITIDSPLNHTWSLNLGDLRNLPWNYNLVLNACNSFNVDPGCALGEILLTSQIAKEIADVTNTNRDSYIQAAQNAITRAKQYGVHVMTIGNRQDCLWDLNVCSLPHPSFISPIPDSWYSDTNTMIIDKADVSHLFDLGRRDLSTNKDCNLSDIDYKFSKTISNLRKLGCIGFSHGNTLKSDDVLEKIGTFIEHR